MISESKISKRTNSCAECAQSPISTEIGKSITSGEGKVFYYGLVGTRDYYHRKTNKGLKSQSVKMSLASEEKNTEELRASKIYVSRSPNTHCNLGEFPLRGGIVKLKRKIKVYNASETLKIIKIQQWWRVIIQTKTIYLTNSKKLHASYNLDNGGIVSFNEDRTNRFITQTNIKQRLEISISEIETTEKKKEQMVFSEGDLTESNQRDKPDGVMVKKVRPYTIDKVNVTNYGEYYRKYLSSQIAYRSTPGKTRLKAGKKNNNRLLKQQLREVWINETEADSNTTFSFNMVKKVKKEIPLSISSRESYIQIKVPSKPSMENKEMNTIEWNELIRKDSEIAFQFQRLYKMKNWNKTNMTEKFSIEAPNEYDLLSPMNIFLLPNVRKRLLQQQLNYIKEQSTSINLQGNHKDEWNVTNFSERFNINYESSNDKPKVKNIEPQNKSKPILVYSMTPQPLSLQFKGKKPQKDITYALIFSKEQMQEREKLLKVQHDQSNDIYYKSNHLRWNWVNKEQAPSTQNIFLKHHYKKINWNKMNTTSSFNLNELGKQKGINQSALIASFIIEKTPIRKCDQWKEKVNKERAETFGFKSDYERKDWNKINRTELAESFKEKGIENEMKFLQDLFFSISAKKNDYEIIFTDKDKGNLFKLTKRDIMYLWNKMNTIDRINHKEETVKIIENDTVILTKEKIDKEIIRVKAAPKRPQNSHDEYEMIDGDAFQLNSFIRRFPQDLMKKDKVKEDFELKGGKKKKMTREELAALSKEYWNKENNAIEENEMYIPHEEKEENVETYKPDWNAENSIYTFRFTFEKKRKHTQPITKDIDWDLVREHWKTYNTVDKIEDNDLCYQGEIAKDKWNKRNKRAEEECKLDYKRESHKARWNKHNQIDEQNNDFTVTGSDDPNLFLLFKHWNKRNKKTVEDDNDLYFAGETHADKWNRNNQTHEEVNDINIKGSTDPNLYLVLERWNKRNKQTEEQIEMKFTGERQAHKWNKHNQALEVTSISIKGSINPNLFFVQERWNKKNKQKEHDEIVYVGERQVDKWNRNNKQDQINEIDFKGSTEPNLLLILPKWNETNKRTIEEIEFSYVGKLHSDEWNKKNKQEDEQDNKFHYSGESHKARWNKHNETDEQNNDFTITGSDDPNLFLLFKHWNKRNKKTVEDDNDLYFAGETHADKWNRNNQTHEEVNDINIKGTTDPNLYLVLERWNKRNKQTKEQIEMKFTGVKQAHKWNKHNQIHDERYTFNIKGSDEPNLILVQERWNKKNKQENDHKSKQCSGLNPKDKWNQQNEREEQGNDFTIEGSTDPNLLLIFAKWNKKNKRNVEDIEFSYIGELQSNKWNRNNELNNQSNDFTVKGSTDPNLQLVLERWNKKNKLSEEELNLQGESQQDKWNKRNKTIEEENYLHYLGESHKDKWNKHNKTDDQSNDLLIKGSTDPNLILVRERWNKTNVKKEQDNELTIEGSTDPNLLLILAKWNKNNKRNIEDIEFSYIGELQSDKWNRNNEKDDQSNDFTVKGSTNPNLYLVFDRWNKRNKRDEETTELHYIGESHFDKWNKKNETNDQDNDFTIKGSTEPNLILVQERWNKKNKEDNEHRDRQCPGESHKDKWNRINESEEQRNDFTIKGSSDPNLLLILAKWNKINQKTIEDNNDFSYKGKSQMEKWNKHNERDEEVTDINIKGSIDPNLFLVLERWNKRNKTEEEGIELHYSGESHKARWNKHNETDEQNNDFTITGSDDPNLFLLFKHWNKRNKKTVEEDNDLYFAGETHADKWNRNNQTHEEVNDIIIKGSTDPNFLLMRQYWTKHNQKKDNENELSYLGENQTDKWIKNNQALEVTSISIKGSINPNLLLVQERWNKKNKQKEHDEIVYVGERQVDKWNDTNKRTIEDIEFSYVGKLHSDEWNQKNKQEDEQDNKFHYSGESHKARWNKHNETDEQNNDFTITGSDDPNLFLLFKHWNKRNKKTVEDDNDLYFAGETHADKWNKNNQTHEEVNDINIKGSTDPNLYLVLERWNKRNKQTEEQIEMKFTGVKQAHKWNKYSQALEVTSISIKGSINPNLFFVQERWNKKNKQKEHDEIVYVGERQVDKWNDTNKRTIEDIEFSYVGKLHSDEWNQKNKQEDNKFHYSGESHKVRWNKHNQIDEQNNDFTNLNLYYPGKNQSNKWNKHNKTEEKVNDITIKGSTDPNLYFIFQRWNKKNHTIQDNHGICYHGQSHAKKWNNKNQPEEQSNVIDIKGTNQIKWFLILEHWNKCNKPIKEHIALTYSSKRDIMKWNEENHLETIAFSLSKQIKPLVIERLRPYEQDKEIKTNHEATEIVEKSSEHVLRSKKPNTLRFEIRDTWKEVLIYDTQPISFTIDNTLPPRKLPIIQVQHNPKEFIEPTSYSFDILSKKTKKKERLNDAEERNKISQNEDFHFLIDEEEYAKEQEDKRRRRIAKQIRIEHDYKELLLKPKPQQIKESKFNQNNLFNTLNEDFHILSPDKKRNTDQQEDKWNKHNKIDFNEFEIRRKPYKKQWDEELEKNNNDNNHMQYTYVPNAILNKKWNKKNEMNTFSHSIPKDDTKPKTHSWYGIIGIDNQEKEYNNFNIKGKSNKDKWNEYNIQSSTNEIEGTIKGVPLYTKWNKNNTSLKQNEYFLKSPIPNLWNTKNNAINECQLYLSPKERKENKIIPQTRLVIKPKAKIKSQSMIEIKDVANDRFTLIPHSQSYIKKWNMKNKIEKSYDGYLEKSLLRKQWSSRKLSQQHESIDYKGVIKQSNTNWNKVNHLVSKERVNVERTRKDWNDMNIMESTSNYLIKAPAPKIRKKEIQKTKDLDVVEIKEKTEQITPVIIKKNIVIKEEQPRMSSTQIDMKITKKEKEDSFDKDDDILKTVPKKKNKKMDDLFTQMKTRTQKIAQPEVVIHEIKEEQKEQSNITNVRQFKKNIKQDQPKNLAQTTKTKIIDSLFNDGTSDRDNAQFLPRNTFSPSPDSTNQQQQQRKSVIDGVNQQPKELQNIRNLLNKKKVNKVLDLKLRDLEQYK